MQLQSNRAILPLDTYATVVPLDNHDSDIQWTQKRKQVLLSFHITTAQQAGAYS